MAVQWQEIPGLADAIEAAGYQVWGEGGEYRSTDDVAVQAIIDGYDAIGHVRAMKLGELAAHRWGVQQAGFELGGVTFQTDAEARANLTGAALAAFFADAAGEPYSVTWKSVAGPIELSGATVTAAARAVEAWVRGLFDREAEVAAQIAALPTWQEVQAFDVAAVF